MKRICLILIALAMLLALLCGCNSNDGADLNQVIGSVGGEVNVNSPGDFKDFLEQEGEDAEQTPTTPDPEEQPEQPEEQPEQPEEQPEEQPGEEQPEEEQPGEEETKAPVDYTTDDWITVCSYNVKVLYYDHIKYGNGTPMSKFEAVCEELRKIDADVVGLQELDRFSNRSGAQVDQLKSLADELGYPYYFYTKTTSSGSGEYGHGIMSRYPILSNKSYYFADFDGDIDASEPRGFSRSEMRVGNKVLVLYNAHLAGHQGEQIMNISLMMEKDMQRNKYAVLTGDMNAYPELLQSYVDAETCTLLNTVENPQNTTYLESVTLERVNPIDNILITNNLEHYWDEYLKSGIMTVETSASDHLPIYTYVRMK